MNNSNIPDCSSEEILPGSEQVEVLNKVSKTKSKIKKQQTSQQWSF